jgi:hypothetical protein
MKANRTKREKGPEIDLLGVGTEGMKNLPWGIGEYVSIATKIRENGKRNQSTLENEAFVIQGLRFQST